MSVGVQRLREEPDRIRQGAIDKREDPAIVDRALEADASRRRLQAESDHLKAERNAASKRVGEAIRGGAKPDGPEVAELRDASTRAGVRIEEIDARAGGDGGGARGPAPADPEPRRPGGPGRRRGGERHRPDLGRPRPITRSRPPAAAPGCGGRTGRSARPSTSSTTSAAPRSRAPASRSTRARARACSGASSAGSWTSTRRSTASPRSGRRPSSTRRRRAARARSRTRRTRCTSSPATSCTWSPPPRSRSPTSTATRSSRPPSCRSGTRPTRRASGARRAPPARTPAGSSASTSSTRWRWSCSRSRRTAPRRSSG